jgi:DNA segregation ATPase FtsK/SpoIIIE-like protein
MITANIPGRVVFHFPTFQGSRAALDDGRAHGLKIKGRAIAITSLDDLTVQTPFISTDMVKAIVASVLEKKDLDINRRHDVTQEEVREWALRYKAGYLNLATLDKQFSERGLSRDELHDWITSWDGQEFLINGAVYRCEPGSGTIGRRLVIVQDTEDPAEEGHD